MAKVETEQSGENGGSRPLVLIIDDSPIREELLVPLSSVTGLDAQFMLPRFLTNFPEGDLKRISLVIADQFYDSFWGLEHTQAFLERLQSANPQANLIEISYLPQSPVYENSIGVIDSLDLDDTITKTIKALPTKTAQSFLSRIKWMVNPAFQEADKVDNFSERDEDLLRTFTRLINNFSRLCENDKYPKLLKTLDISDDKFSFAFMADNDIKRRKNFLHTSWMMIGHLTANSDEEFYAMPLQRLKEIVSNSLHLDDNG